MIDEELLDGELPRDHTARNTWLRRMLYRQDCIEANFLASDEDYIALRPLEPTYYVADGVHSAFYFRENVATWLGGSPRLNPFDYGIRNTWQLLHNAIFPVRAFSSHMPQVINKALCNSIFDRFVNATGPPYDEWSLYFNVAAYLYRNHFDLRPYSTLAWPMRTGDWFPEIEPKNQRSKIIIRRTMTCRRLDHS